jgi:hypothetical protein
LAVGDRNREDKLEVELEACHDSEPVAEWHLDEAIHQGQFVTRIPDGRLYGFACIVNTFLNFFFLES